MPILRVLAVLLVTARATQIASKQVPYGGQRQDSRIFMEVAGRGGAIASRDQQPAPYLQQQPLPSAPYQQPAPYTAMQPSAFGYPHEYGSPPLTPEQRLAMSGQTWPQPVFTPEQRLAMSGQTWPTQVLASVPQNYATGSLNLVRTQKTSNQAQDDQKAAAENQKAAAAKAAQQQEDKLKAKEQEEEAHAALQRQDDARREHSDDMRRREAELEWQEEPADDNDDDGPKVDWAHADRLRGWGHEGWTMPKPAGMGSHHQHKTTPMPAVARDVSDGLSDAAAAAAARSAAAATDARFNSLPVQGPSLPTSDLKPDVPLLQTEQK